jgi:hypothetical protein
VAECAVIGVTDTLKGQLPMGFLCLNKGAETPPEQVVAECVKLVRDKIGPVAAFKLAVVVDRLPKTRSGKILRGTMVKIADGESYKMPATIDDPGDPRRDRRGRGDAGLRLGQGLSPGSALRLAGRRIRLPGNQELKEGTRPRMSDDLIAAANEVRAKAYAPYSGFQVGAALLSTSGSVHLGCNVENVAYPEGTCAEAGAIAAMIAAGDTGSPRWRSSPMAPSRCRPAAAAARSWPNSPPRRSSSPWRRWTARPCA